MRKVLILFVRAYQVVLSPLFRGCCRFEPSCSNYMIEAVEVHGALKGTLLGLWRLLLCLSFFFFFYYLMSSRGRWKNDFNTKE